MLLDLVHLLLESMGRIDLFPTVQRETIPQGGGQAGNAAGGIQEKLGETGF